jgi:hypothetical protein
LEKGLNLVVVMKDVSKINGINTKIAVTKAKTPKDLLGIDLKIE